MKKLLFVVAFAAIGFTSVNAQEVKFGAKAGVNFASVTGDLENVDGKVAFHIGGVAEIMISDKFSVQPELMYSAQGYKGEESGSEEIAGETYSYKEEVTGKLDYIILPIMAKYYVAEGFSIEAGPQVGFLLNAEEDYDYTETFMGETSSESGTEDMKDYMSSIDFGVNFGLGYKMESGLNFGARYNLGLSNVYDGEGDYEIKNGVIQVSVGYMF